MSKSFPRIAAALIAALLAFAGTRADAAVFATFDADQYDSNGFVFGDFSAGATFPVSTSGGVLSIDVMNDLDSVNGLFGGTGSDLVADFDAATTRIEVAVTVDELNVASAFNIVLVDNDGENTGEEYQYTFDISGLTPGMPTVLTRPINDFSFRQAAFEQTDGDMIPNFGLRQVQIQSVFDGTDRLKIDVDSVKIVDPDDPLLTEFTTSTYEAHAGKYTYGTFAVDGALDTTGPNFVINAGPTGSGGGGVGINGIGIDFEANEYQIEVEAKLLPGNTAEAFNVLLTDNDGEDTGPEMGSDDYLFAIPTSSFNETEFTTFTIPLGTGSESNIETTFGFTNGGDGLQNFGLSQMQIQATADDMLNLGIEISRFSIVELTETGDLAGDYNNDGIVSQGDLDLVLQNWGEVTPPVPDGWINEQPTGQIAQAQLDGVLQNWGNSTNVATSTVPEPTTLLLLAMGAGLAFARRR